MDISGPDHWTFQVIPMIVIPAVFVGWMIWNSIKLDLEREFDEHRRDARQRIKDRRTWRFSHLCSDGRRWWFKDPESMP